MRNMGSRSTKSPTPEGKDQACISFRWLRNFPTNAATGKVQIEYSIWLRLILQTYNMTHLPELGCWPNSPTTGSTKSHWVKRKSVGKLGPPAVTAADSSCRSIASFCRGKRAIDCTRTSCEVLEKPKQRARYRLGCHSSYSLAFSSASFRVAAA